MTTPRPTAIHALSRRAALQCLGLGALATAWPASAAVLAVEHENEPGDALPAWLTFPEQQWQRITPAEATLFSSRSLSDVSLCALTSPTTDYVASHAPPIVRAKIRARTDREPVALTRYRTRNRAIRGRLNFSNDISHHQ